MHVHHDITDFSQDDMRRVVRNLRHVEAAMASFVPSHRIDGSNSCGARLISDWGWNDLESYVNNGSLLPQNARRSTSNRHGGCPVTRYSSFNFNSVLTYGTIEFRLLGHTLNTAKVKAWIELGQALMKFTKEGGEFTRTMNATEMTDTLVASGHLSRWAARRFCQEVARRHPATVAA
jgi:hypothetical protein